MGWITGVIIAALVLVVLGIGAQAFLSGLWSGAQKVSTSPIVQNLTGSAKEFVAESVRNATNNVIS